MGLVLYYTFSVAKIHSQVLSFNVLFLGAVCSVDLFSKL